MNTVLFSIVLYFCNLNDNILVRADTISTNRRPIVGILSQEFYGEQFNLDQMYPNVNYSSYIAASYVKSVESSGARVVPILIGKSRSYYQELMSKINGVLLPGGDACFNTTNGFADAGQHIYDIAIELNNAGDYFPIHGTCLGFELLIILASGREPENKINCRSHSNVPLNFTDDFRESKMFKRAPEEVIDLLATENITVNNHHFCIVDENLKYHNLEKDWKVTSHSVDNDGIIFIASVENIRYPFYGIQFHPEKSSYEWNLSNNYPHSMSAVQVNRYFMDFFVDECRKNVHTFGIMNEENSYLIYNYEPRFTGAYGSFFEQIYVFEPNGTKPI